jgi:hypothetical protein
MNIRINRRFPIQLQHSPIPGKQPALSGSASVNTSLSNHYFFFSFGIGLGMMKKPFQNPA